MTDDEHWKDYGAEMYLNPRDEWTEAAMELEAQRLVKEMKERAKHESNHNNRNSRKVLP